VPDVRRNVALLAGVAAGTTAAILLRRRRAPTGRVGAASSPDPRAEELRRKLAEAREQAADEDDFEAAGMAGETQLEEGRPLPPAAAMSGGDIADARRRVHEEARTATDEMRRSDEPETR
jgi:hypothetical protein